MPVKVVFVKAHFAPIGRNETVDVPTGETQKGLLGWEKQITRKEQRFVQTGNSDTMIDGARLANDIQLTIDQLSDAGFEIVTMTPVISGRWNATNGTFTDQGVFLPDVASDWYAYGYSVTEGVVIVARKGNGDQP